MFSVQPGFHVTEVTMTDAHSLERDAPITPACFSLLAIVLLGTRFVQGFIFWGGASRRLFYDFHEIAGVDHAVKLDFEAAGFVANKLVHALPGALWVQAPLRGPWPDLRLGNPALGIREHRPQCRVDADLRVDWAPRASMSGPWRSPASR
jgi:hypothetical protein